MYLALRPPRTKGRRRGTIREGARDGKIRPHTQQKQTRERETRVVRVAFFRYTRSMSNQAEIYKAQGNAALQARQFEDAVDLYSKAIALDPSNHIFFSNRAAAFASLERWREALDDSYEVVTLKPDWVKGWVRRGGAFTGLGQHEEARKAYVKAANIEPAMSRCSSC